MAVLLRVGYRETRQVRHETMAVVLVRNDGGLDKGVVERWSDSGCFKKESTGSASRLNME